ncbi:sialin-like isoform X1 [Mya arenaria]|uniref:sialin-like isoform X1 n=1 Tax=Mya arenaria TaxID=6604 RepID=UPI0022E355FC|nr:sialin-like isoform X1 [Mya arenaria]
MKQKVFDGTGYEIVKKKQDDSKNESSHLPTDKVPVNGVCCPSRLILAGMGFWYGVLGYGLSTNMSVAIVCMAKLPNGNASFSQNQTININWTDRIQRVTSVYQIQTNISIANSHLSSCESVDAEQFSSETAEFEWSKKTQSLILSGFFYGYVVTQIPGGWMATRFGGKIVIGLSMALASLFTLLMPMIARASPYAVFVNRIAIGISCGIAKPGWYALTGAWALSNERTRFISTLWIGQTIGTVAGYASSGFLCLHGFDNGWASIFYIHGAFGVLFVAGWSFLVFDRPENHPRISQIEYVLIRSNLKRTTERAVSDTNKMSIPWRDICTYTPAIAVVVTHACDTCTYYLILTCLPQYLKEVLKFDIQTNGLYSALPWISMLIGVILAGIGADSLRAKGWISVTNVRKFFQVSASIGVAVFLCVPGFLTCDQRGLVIACLCACTMLEGLGFGAGYTCNWVDMSPRFASLLFAVSNTVASIPGIVVPVIVAELTENQTSEDWRVVLVGASVISVLGALVYGMFSSSDLAPWSEHEYDEKEMRRRVRKCIS